MCNYTVRGVSELGSMLIYCLLLHAQTQGFMRGTYSHCKFAVVCHQCVCLSSSENHFYGYGNNRITIVLCCSFMKYPT